MEKIIQEMLSNLESKSNLNAYEKKRIAKAKEILANEKDCGKYGKAFEILSVKESSHKTSVASQNRNDGYFTYNGKKTKAVEKKTNGGRIEKLFTLHNPQNAFIVYQMSFDTRLTYCKDGTPRAQKHYETKALLLKVSDFIAILEHCNAIKVISHSGKNDVERSVQGDSVKLCKLLQKYPVEYIAEREYFSSDFDNLKLW